MLNKLTNVLKTYSASLDHAAGQIKFGIVTSSNPANGTARVLIQPEGVLSGWLPVSSQWVGNGWGMICPPAAGEQVLLAPQEGDVEQGVIIGRTFSTEFSPPLVPVGEFWLVHASGSSIKLCNDGTIRVSGDLHVAGDVYDKAGPLSGLRGHYNIHTHTSKSNNTTTSPTPTD